MDHKLKHKISVSLSHMSDVTLCQIMFAVQKALDEKGGQGAASLPSHLASFTGVTKKLFALFHSLLSHSM
jgi:hypothetical protein